MDESKDPDNIRLAGQITVNTNNTDNSMTFICIYSIQYENKVNALLSIGRTLFVCIVLAIASIYFSHDATVLVLNPIERMLEKVKLLAKNPLAAASDEIEQAGLLTTVDA